MVGLLQTQIDFTPEHPVLLKKSNSRLCQCQCQCQCHHHASLKNRLQTGKRFWRKSFQLEEKFVWKDNRKQWSVIQLRSKLHNTTCQIPRQRRLKQRGFYHFSQIVVLLRRKGPSPLHATIHHFRKILHLHLLEPIPFQPVIPFRNNQLVITSTSHHKNP